MVRKNIQKSPGLRSLPSLKEYSKDSQDLGHVNIHMAKDNKIPDIDIGGIGIFRTLQGKWNIPYWRVFDFRLWNIPCPTAQGEERERERIGV